MAGGRDNTVSTAVLTGLTLINGAGGHPTLDGERETEQRDRYMNTSLGESLGLREGLHQQSTKKGCEGG